MKILLSLSPLTEMVLFISLGTGGTSIYFTLIQKKLISGGKDGNIWEACRVLKKRRKGSMKHGMRTIHWRNYLLFRKTKGNEKVKRELSEYHDCATALVL